MKKIGILIGKIVFLLATPALWIYLRHGKRTRVLIICGDEFLVLRSWLGRGDWGLPGGGLHKDENSLQGVLREVREETGITLDEHDVKFLYHTRHNRRGFRFDYDCFAVQLAAKPTIALQKIEIADFAWTSVNNPSLPISEDAKYALAQWQKKP